jgi:hypothetical protein
MSLVEICKVVKNSTNLRAIYRDTIARDLDYVLGIGIPPTRTLNYDLLKLKSSFRSVDDNSDLATFRWDLVESCTDMSRAVPYEGQNRGGQSIALEPPSRPNISDYHIGSQANSNQQISRSQGTGEQNSYGAFNSSQPTHTAPSTHQSSSYYQTPYNSGAYGQNSSRPQVVNGSHPHSHVSPPQNQLAARSFSSTPLQSSSRQLPALNRPLPSQQFYGSHTANTSSRLTNQSSAPQTATNIQTPAQKSYDSPPAMSSQKRLPTARSRDSPELPTPHPPERNMPPPKPVPPSSSKQTPPLFRFSKEQRAVLEKEAMINMYPAMPLKQRLALEIGVDVKKVSVSWSSSSGLHR